MKYLSIKRSTGAVKNAAPFGGQNMKEELEKIFEAAEKIYAEFDDKCGEMWKYGEKGLNDVYWSYKEADNAFCAFLSAINKYRAKYKEN